MEAMTKDGHKKMVDGSHRRKKGNVKTHQGEPQSQQGTRRLLKCRIVKRGDVAVLGKKTIQTVPVKTGELRKGGKGFKRKAAGDADKAAVPQKRRRPAKTVPGGSSSSKSYDDVDQQALHRMTKERVDWSTQEDSMLLLCKVALLFLSSERRHGMLVNWCVIRDILHKHCRSARDKTSKACQRRVMYVMKNPQTKLNVDVYVGEALQDTALVQEFRKGKKYVKTDLEKNTAMFQSLLAKLLKKFKASLTGSAVELPDKLEEVYKKYNVVKGPKTTVTVHKDVTNEHDIYASVLHNVIHSAMLLNDKTGRDHELYQLFRQYPENLLLEVFNCMKNDGIITRIKKHEHRKFRWNAIPCVSLGNYHVAQRYMYRWFSRYPRNVFIAASDILEQMPEQPTGGSISAPTNDGEWMENRKTGGCTAVIVSLMAQGQVRFNLVIPERIIAIDSARKKGQVGSKVTELTLSDEEEEAMLEEVEKMKMSGVTQGYSSTDDDKQTRGDIKSGDSTDHTPTAETATDVGSGNHDNVVGGASSSIIFDKRVNVGASRVMLAMLREQPVGGASKVLHPTDNVVIKMCDVKLQLKANQPRAPPGGPLPGPEHAVHEFLERWNQSHLYLHPKTQFHMLRSLRIQQPASVDYSHVITSCHDEFTSQSLHVEDMTRIYEEVKGQGVLGITCYQLQQLFCGVRMLDLYLKILLNHRMILQVGVTVFRYTSHEHARPWLIYSLKNVKGRGGDDVLELPVGLELPGYFPVREIPAADASVAITKPACVSNTSEADEGQTVATLSGVTGLSDTDPHETTELAMKRQLFESTLESAPPHKRLHLDTVTTDVQNKYVADLSQVTSVEVQTSKSPEHVKVKRQLSTSIVAMTTDSDQPLLKSPPPVQHLVMHGDLVTQGPSDTVTLGRSCRSLTTQLSFKTVSPKRRTTVSVKATKDRSPTAVKLQATSVAATRERSPAAVKLQATSVAATRDRSPTAVKLQATSVAATRDRSPAAVKLQATSVAATKDRSPTAVKLQATSVAATRDRSPAAVKLLATSVTATRDRSPTAVTLQATSVAATRDRSPAAVKLQATSVAAARDRSPAAVKLQATSVAAARDKSQAVVKIQATSVAATRDRSPAAVKLQATSVAAAKDKSVAAAKDRSPAAVKLQATSVTTNRDRSPAAAKLQATSVTATRDRSPVAVKLQSTSVTAIRDRSPAPVKLQATPVAATRARSPAAAKLQSTSVAATSSHMSQGSPSQQLTLDPNILAAITKSGVRGPFRLQLPANLKLPTSGSGQKVRFSVMSKTEAAKLGLGCSTAVTMPAGQPQRATSQPTNIQPPTRITVPPSCQCGNTASESSTVITLPSLKATHPSESSSKHPAGGTSVLTVKMKLVTKGTGKKDDSVPQLDGTTDDHVDGATVDQESQRKSISVDDKLKGPCEDNVSHINGPLFDDTSVIPQLDGTADGESPNKSDKSDNVNTQPDDVIAQSDDVIAQSDDVIAQSDDVIAQSVDMLPVGSTDTEGIGRKGTDEDREENHREHQTVKNERPERTRHPVKLSLDSPENKCNYRKVRLVARPWKTPEGTVNRPTLKMMLEAVMMFIMTKPGVTRGDLITKYNPLLHPVPLMELTEMLQELGCVKQCIVGRSHKPSVFAPKAKLSQVAMDTGEEVVTYIPTVDCIIKLGQFEAQLSR